MTSFQSQIRGCQINQICRVRAELLQHPSTTGKHYAVAIASQAYVICIAGKSPWKNISRASLRHVLRTLLQGSGPASGSRAGAEASVAHAAGALEMFFHGAFSSSASHIRVTCSGYRIIMFSSCGRMLQEFVPHTTYVFDSFYIHVSDF